MKSHLGFWLLKSQSYPGFLRLTPSHQMGADMPYPDMKQRAFSINKLSLACFSALLATPAQATEFLGLGDLPGGIFYSSAYAVSADGSVVAGEVSAGGDLTPFRWTASGGMVPLGVAGEATGISADGNTIAGSFANAGHSEAYRWTAGGGVTGLGTSGYTHSYGRAISPDGGTVVGMVAGAGTTQAFRWTAGGGMDLLGWFAGGTPQSTALGVSDNGVVVGYGGHIGGVEAFYWTPALGAITGLGVFGPVAPAQMLGQRRLVVVFRVFEFQFPVIVDLEEEHPDQLADALRIAIDTHILAHDVLNGLDNSADIAHRLNLFTFIDCAWFDRLTTNGGGFPIMVSLSNHRITCNRPFALSSSKGILCKT